MTNKFKAFAAGVEQQLRKLTEINRDLLEVSTNGLSDIYLSSFPEGTNPIYRERTEHDCNCCLTFIRRIGGVVAIIDGDYHTIWDNYADFEYPYNVVAREMMNAVRGRAIEHRLTKYESKFGTVSNNEFFEGEVYTHYHFHGTIPGKYVRAKDDLATFIGESRQQFATLKRSLEDITSYALETVLELINSDMLYRGNEHKTSIQLFKNLHDQYVQINDPQMRINWIWEQISIHPTARGIHSSVIGSLLMDLSKGVPLEDSVRMFESKVAPENYKRSKSLITPAMINNAQKTLSELNLEHSIYRRLANFTDISVNDVLFVDRSVKGRMRDSGSLMDLLGSQAAPKRIVDMAATDIGINDFINNVLPKASKVQLIVGNNHQSNLMTLTAPIREDVEPIFKWSNNIAWSYNGNITDSSIRSRVKSAGGNTDNSHTRMSLAWFNGDDLDLHMHHDNIHVYYGAKGHPDFGALDVDMNAGGPTSRNPVENISFRRAPRDGSYLFQVQNFRKRESIDVGFEFEFIFGDNLFTGKYEKPVSNFGDVDICTFTVKSGEMTNLKFNPAITMGSTQKEVWGIKTNTLVNVSSIITSPNHWNGEKIGNKHTFFILEGCKVDEEPRGIYNEYLRDELTPHRKVFEVLGDQTKCELVEDQMTGIGFSETQSNEVTVVVDNRPYKVKFN